MIRSNLARSRATAISCQSSGWVQSYPLPVRGPAQPSRPNPAWGLKAQNHIKCIFVMAVLALLCRPFLRCQVTGRDYALGESRHADVQTPLLGAKVARLQNTAPGAGRTGAADVLGLGGRHLYPLAAALSVAHAYCTCSCLSTRPGPRYGHRWHADGPQSPLRPPRTTAAGRA